MSYPLSERHRYGQRPPELPAVELGCRRGSDAGQGQDRGRVGCRARPGSRVRYSRLALTARMRSCFSIDHRLSAASPTRRRACTQLRGTSAETRGCIFPGPGLRRSRRHGRVQTRTSTPLKREDLLVRPAGFEPATRCLEGKAQGSRQVAWCRPMRRSTADTIAGSRVASLCVCRRWLPVGSPNPACPAEFKRLKTIASTERVAGTHAVDGSGSIAACDLARDTSPTGWLSPRLSDRA